MHVFFLPHPPVLRLARGYLGLQYNAFGGSRLCERASKVYFSPYICNYCCFIFNMLTLEVGWLHLDMLQCDSVMLLVSFHMC